MGFIDKPNGEVLLNSNMNLIQRDREDSLREQALKHFDDFQRFDYLIMCSDSNPMYLIGIKEINQGAIELNYWEQEMKVVHKRIAQKKIAQNIDELFDELKKEAVVKSKQHNSESESIFNRVYVFKKNKKKDPFTPWVSI